MPADVKDGASGRRGRDVVAQRLSREELRAQILEGWVLDAGALPIFEMGLEAREEFYEAKAMLRRPKLTLRERAYWTRAARDARLAFLKAWRQLNLDAEPLHDIPGRPPGGGGKRSKWDGVL